MSVLQAKMEAVASDLVQDQGLPPEVAAAGDFLNWLMELAKELIPLIMGCFASREKAVAAMNNPNWFQEMRLNVFLRRQMDRQSERRLLRPLTNSLVKLGKTLTVEEWSAMTQEA